MSVSHSINYINETADMMQNMKRPFSDMPYFPYSHRGPHLTADNRIQPIHSHGVSMMHTVEMSMATGRPEHMALLEHHLLPRMG